MSHLPSIGSIKSFAFKGCKIPISPTIIIHIPAQIIECSHRAIIKTANTTTSINAVGFPIAARAKNTPEMIRYFRDSLLFFFFSKICCVIYCIATNPHKIANNVKVITPKSVLLSTNTRNAPIPLVSQSNRALKPSTNTHFLIIVSLVVKKF